MSIDARRAGGGMAARPANIYDFYIDVHRFFNNDADTDDIHEDFILQPTHANGRKGSRNTCKRPLSISGI